MSDAGHDESHRDREEVAHGESRTRHEVGIIEGLVGADGCDRIKNGRGQHVCEGAGSGETVFDETSNDGYDGALTDRENRA